jgi:tetratricopeptide (TPR) repeat protein
VGRIGVFARYGCAFFLASILIGAAPAARGANSESEQAYTLGRAAMSRNSKAEALALFKKAIADDDTNDEARYHLGVLYSQNINTYGLAEEQLLELPGRAMRRGHGYRDDLIFRAGIALGKLYVKSGRNAQAIRLVRNVVAAAPPSAQLDEAHAVLGLALYYERAYDDAIFELRRAIKLNPNNTAAIFNIKTIRTRLEHFNAAKIYSRMGDHLGAIGEYRVAISLDPRFIEARYRLGVELLQNGDKAEALKELRRAELISDQFTKLHEIRYSMGLALRDLGQFEGARAQFERVIATKPRFAPAHNELGKLQMARKDYQAALKNFADAIQLDAKEEYAANMQKAILAQATPR